MKLYESLFGAYPDGLLVIDGGGQIVRANPAACLLLGYREDELVGLSVDLLVPERARNRHVQYRAGYAKAPRARPMGTQTELVAVRRDGSEVIVEIALSPLHDDGQPLVVAAVRAIGTYPRVRQAIKRGRYGDALARIAALTAEARDAPSLLERAGRAACEALGARNCVVFLLEPGLDMFRVAGGCGLVQGERVGDRVPNRAQTAPGFVLATGGPVLVADYATEKRFQVPAAYRQAGLRRALAVPLADPTRRVGALSVRADVSTEFGEEELRFVQTLAGLLATCLARFETEEQLRHAQRLETVGQLTGGIAHDFNNLLTVILGNLQVLQEQARDAGAQGDVEMLDAAQRAAQRGAELTGRLLAFSRRQVLSPTRVDAAQAVQALAGMLRRTIDPRVAIETDLPAQPLYLRGDPSQFESAMLNTAINARDAMPDGGLLRLAVRRVERLPGDVEPDVRDMPGPFIAVSVADNGSGMSEAVRARAFEPFFTTKAAGRGTGMGLSTVYGFARQSMGAVTLDSVPGQGTVVTLYLPEWAEADTASPGPAPARGASRELPQGLRVLLVEDDDTVRSVVQRYLQRLGAEVHACASAAQARERLAGSENVDLMLSDISLGRGERGTELAASVRQQLPQLPVLLMTGYASGEVDIASTWPLLRKPFDRDTLAAAIAAVIKARR